MFRCLIASKPDEWREQNTWRKIYSSVSKVIFSDLPAKLKWDILLCSSRWDVVTESWRQSITARRRLKNPKRYHAKAGKEERKERKRQCLFRTNRKESWLQWFWGSLRKRKLQADNVPIAWDASDWCCSKKPQLSSSHKSFLNHGNKHLLIGKKKNHPSCSHLPIWNAPSPRCNLIFLCIFLV